MYDEYVETILNHLNDNQIKEEIKAVVTYYSQNRTKVFNSLSHGNEGRPCITNGGGISGKPCVFPFVWPDCKDFRPSGICNSEGPYVPQVHTKCIPEGNKEWCSTGHYLNNSHVTGKWGYCSPHCKKQVISTENIASDEFKVFWEEKFYILFVDDIGHCHTYNPGHSSSTGYDESLLHFWVRFCAGCQNQNFCI